LGPTRPGGYSTPIGRVLIDPTDHTHLLAFGGSHRRLPAPGATAWGAVWESRDDGLTWRRRSTVADGGNVVAADFLAGNPTRLVAAVADRGVFVSRDGGRTWAPANTGLPRPQVAGLAAHPEKEIVWAALDARGTDPGGIWKSVDGGRSWRAANRGLSRVRGTDYGRTSRYPVVAVAPASPNVVYTADRGWTSQAIFRSDDGGVTWRTVATRSSIAEVPWRSSPSADALGINPRDARVVYAGQQEYVVRTTDGGATWSDGSNIRAGRGWHGRGFSGLVATGIAFNAARPGEILVTAMDGGNLLQTTEGLVWEAPLHGFDPYNGATDVAVGGGGAAYALLGQRGGFNGVAVRAESDGTWRVRYGPDAGLPARSPRGAAGEIEASRTDAKVAYATIAGVLYVTGDSGSTWRAGSEAGLQLHAIAIDPADDRHLYAAGPNAVYETRDGGASFTVLSGSPTGVTRLVVAPGAGSRLFAIAWRETGLWERAGTEWRRLSADTYIADVAVSPSDPDHLVAVTNDHPYHDESFASGVWYSTDGGNTWTPQNDGLPMLRVATVAFDPNVRDRIVIGTFGRGFFERTTRAPVDLRALPAPRRPSTPIVDTDDGLRRVAWSGLAAVILAGVMLGGLTRTRRRRVEHLRATRTEQ
jgi:hypothetical protein